MLVEILGSSTSLLLIFAKAQPKQLIIGWKVLKHSSKLKNLENTQSETRFKILVKNLHSLLREQRIVLWHGLHGTVTLHLGKTNRTTNAIMHWNAYKRLPNLQKYLHYGQWKQNPENLNISRRRWKKKKKQKNKYDDDSNNEITSINRIKINVSNASSSTYAILNMCKKQLLMHMCKIYFEKLPF